MLECASPHLYTLSDPTQLVAELSREETREAALLELSKKREAFPDLAPILWHSFGTTSTLLQATCLGIRRSLFGDSSCLQSP